MASQKHTNDCVAAIALAALTYISTPHCLTIARIAFVDFCLAIHIDALMKRKSAGDAKSALLNISGGPIVKFAMIQTG
ncbi:hypothetical protein GSUB_07590 [Geoalkalibacter subterraneus]|uniref:Uncharacterized protein n=1 Tax=Geoalkalibacter subterraneus TaxID=483547 RepID=A0A0B5FE43_9BACT|nr:hypothetical protein GSUB_07590 [Geoalkalibacter subterraneus]